MKSGVKLTPSWDLLQKSIDLVRSHPYSVFWLVFVASVMSNVGSYMIDRAASASGLVLDKMTPSQFTSLIQSSSVAQVGVAAIGMAILWALLVYPASMVMSVKAVRGGDDDPWAYVRQSFHYFWRLYGLLLLITVMVVVGLIAFIVPGVILFRRYILAPYYLVERDTEIFEALKLTALQTKTERGSVWGVLGVTIVIGMAASIVTNIPYLGLLLGPAVSVLYFFGFPLRQQEMSINHPDANS